MNRNAVRYISLILILYIVGCASATYKPHPGAINLLDSQAFDVLVSTKAVIDQTKADLAGGTWSATIATKVKTVLNSGVIPAYNVLDTTYQAYHLAAVASDPGTAVQSAMNNVSAQLSTLAAAKAGN
jgi:hypothetical protein